MNTQNKASKVVIDELAEIFGKYVTITHKMRANGSDGLLITYHTKKINKNSLAVIFFGDGKLFLFTDSDNVISCDICNPKCYSILEKKIKCLSNKS